MDCCAVLGHHSNLLVGVIDELAKDRDSCGLVSANVCWDHVVG